MSNQKFMKNKTLPPVLENVMVTYNKTIRDNTTQVTKMGFYHDGKFSIPPNWAPFNGVLLPDGFGGDHLTPDEIIEWHPV